MNAVKADSLETLCAVEIRKENLVISQSGFPFAAGMTTASMHDSQYIPFLKHDHLLEYELLADRGCISAGQQLLKRNYNLRSSKINRYEAGNVQRLVCNFRLHFGTHYKH